MAIVRDQTSSGILQEGNLGLDASVVDQNIQTPELLYRLVDQALDLVRLADVGFHRQGLAARCHNLPDDLRCVIRRADVVDDDRGSLLGEADGYGPADAGSSSGDDGHFVLQAHGRSLSPSSDLPTL